MSFLKSFFLLCFIFSIAYFATEAHSDSSVRKLSLNQAVELAFKKNKQFRAESIYMEQAKLGYRSSWEEMFLPNITLNLQGGSQRTIHQLSGTPSYDFGTEAYSHGRPAWSLGLNLGSYTLFNFWKDYTFYQLEKKNYERSIEQFSEAKRRIRFQVISQYFRLKTEMENLQAARRSMTLAQTILTLTETRMRLGNGSEREIASSKMDYLYARNVYLATFDNVRQETWEMNFLLGDALGVRYQLTTPLRYRRLQLTTAQAFQFYSQYAPNIRDIKLSLLTAEKQYELSLKGRYPLPMVTLSGVSVTYTDTFYGNSRDVGTRDSVFSGNLDIGASVGVTWPIFGPGGLFGRRAVQQSGMGQELAQLRYDEVLERGKTSIFSLVGRIKDQEERVSILEETFEHSAKILESMMGEIGSGDASRLELRDAIVQARESEFNYKGGILSHLESKLQLAELIGVDELPGDPF
jgi:outer membrane protein TolC